MNKIKKNIIVTIMIILFIVINGNYVYADPNSSKGFAEYDDAKAEKETEQLIEEHKQNFDALKSSNNYLSNLEVEGYELFPKFDKQTINYEIKEAVTDDTIEIKAEKDDIKASISGDGKILLISGENNITINVTAENGNVRAYSIKVVKETKKELRLSSMSLVADSNEKDVNSIELTPNFDSEIFEYNCNVENYINKININAKANIENAVIEITGNENLKDGLNEILVTVNDEKNEKVFYKININKEKKVEIDSQNDNKTDNKNVIIIITIIGLVLILIIILNKFIRKKKAKHGK